MRRQLVFFLVFLLFLLSGQTVLAKDAKDLMDQMDFSEISRFLEEKSEAPVSFEEMIQALFQGGDISYETIGDYGKDLHFLRSVRFVLGT